MHTVKLSIFCHFLSVIDCNYSNYFLIYFFCLGEFPREVHILVDRFAIEDIPIEKIALEQVSD